jgi:large subunit ribosomal protein L11
MTTGIYRCLGSAPYVKAKYGVGFNMTLKIVAPNMDQLREIAEQKKNDLNSNDVDAATKILAGTARSMGIQVTGV